MRAVVRSTRFRNELKRLKRRGFNMAELYATIDLLAEDGELPPGYSPHKLSREWVGILECHIEGDWLLIYEVTDKEVILHRTGTHADLFD